MHFLINLDFRLKNLASKRLDAKAWLRGLHRRSSTLHLGMGRGLTCLAMLDVMLSWYYCRAMLYISAAYAVMRCLSVMFVYSVKTNKHIFKIFPPSIATLTLWQYLTGTPNGSVECRWGRQKLRFCTNIWLSDR